jgi:hypothetical protein
VIQCLASLTVTFVQTLKEDEHKLRLGNHLLAYLLAFVITGVVVHWATLDVAASAGTFGTQALMEALDYITGV